MKEKESREEYKKRRPNLHFLRKFHWMVNSIFTAFIVFIAVCMAVGIVRHLNERYPEFTISYVRSKPLSDLTSLQLQDCLDALKRMFRDEQKHAQEVFSCELDCNEFWVRYKDWSKQWKKDFERLGISCHLAEIHSSENVGLEAMREIYQEIDFLQKEHNVLIKRYLIQYGSFLEKTNDLFTRAKEVINGAGGV